MSRYRNDRGTEPAELVLGFGNVKESAILDAILGGYAEVAPLADGWRERVSLHQLHPLMLHAVLFRG